MLINNERSLAHVELIKCIEPIGGADNIELATVLGWKVIVKKGEFKVGDKCVYIEIDSQLDFTMPCFSFLAKKDGKIKTMKLSKFNVVSQGIVFKLEDLELYLKKPLSQYEVDSDLTKELNIVKTQTNEEKFLKQNESIDLDLNARTMRVQSRYKKFLKTRFGKWIMRHSFTRKWFIAWFGGKTIKRKAFPTDLINKTDEERIENQPYRLGTGPWMATEKVNGTSSTYVIRIVKNKIKDFAVCSRNVRQLDISQKDYWDSPTNIYWEIALKYDMKKVLSQIAKQLGAKQMVGLQGEILGNVQGNPYKLNENCWYGYNLIVDGIRYNSEEAKKIVESFGLTWVPLLGVIEKLPLTMEDMKASAEGKSIINPKVIREGIVYRALDGKNSFKNVSITYLLKHQN